MNKKQIIESLAKCKLFKDFSISEIEIFLNKNKYFEKHFDKDEFIMFRDDKIEYLIINLRGTLISEAQKYNGESVEVGVINQFDIIADAFIFSENNTLPVDLISKTPVQILFINKDDFKKYLFNNNKLLLNFLCDVSNKAQFLSNKIWFELVNKTIEDKILDYINKNKVDNTISFKPSITSLAHRFGVARPSLSREIKKLCEDSILQKISGNTYKVL